MITVFTGLPGSGKSLMMAKHGLDLLKRNFKYYKKTGVVRLVVTNLRFSHNIEHKYHKFIREWEDPTELIGVKDCDVLWDEIATHLDALHYKDCPLDLKRWLQQHRKFGVDIYGTTQNFAMIDISFRRLTKYMYLLNKLIGSRDRSATRPPVKHPWGLVIAREVDPGTFESEKQEYKYVGIDLLRISKKLCMVYDTSQEIKRGAYPPLQHIHRKCIDCEFTKVVHI